MNKLAYVFWHWPRPTISKDDYLERLRLFHTSLAAHPSEGFSHSVVFEIPAPPWLSADSVAFEDWYLVDDSAALDKLNFAAVSGQNEKPHNTVATEAEGGIAGLYRLKQGDASALATAKYALWFSKSANLSYADLYQNLSSLSSQKGVGLWCRQMTLGPTSEFCFRSEDELMLPAEAATNVYLAPLKIVWSGLTSEV